jgi:DNA-binding NarL/FixJ family response regulator
MSAATLLDDTAIGAGIAVVLGDDHPVMREGLQRSLDAFGFEVVAAVGSGRDAVAAVERSHPDVVLVDMWMPGMDGIRALEIIHQRAPGVAGILLTFDTSDDLRCRALAAGACAVLTKDTEAGDLAAVVASVARGERSPSIEPASGGRDTELSLTTRELDVLELIVRGASTPAIASSLYISAKTVKNHLASIYEKLDVGDRTQAVLAALRLGLISLDRK